MKRSAWVCIVGGIIFELGAAFALWFEHSLLVIVLLHLAGSILWGAGIARTGGLNRGIQGQQAGLAGNVIDQSNNVTNFLGRNIQA